MGRVGSLRRGFITGIQNECAKHPEFSSSWVQRYHVSESVNYDDKRISVMRDEN